MKLKSIRDIDVPFRGNRKIYEFEQKLREEALKWVNDMRAKSDAHWNKLNKSGYTDFKTTKNEDCWGYDIGGIRIEDHHEASGPSPIIEWIAKFFNIETKVYPSKKEE